MEKRSNVGLVVHKWCHDNPLCLSSTGFKEATIPSVSALNRACGGANVPIWQYIIKHARSEREVITMKNKIQFYHKNILRNVDEDTSDPSHVDELNKTNLSLTVENSFCQKRVSDLTENIKSAGITLQDTKNVVNRNSEIRALLLQNHHFLSHKKSSYNSHISHLQQFVKEVRYTTFVHTYDNVRLIPNVSSQGMLQHTANVPTFEKTPFYNPQAFGATKIVLANIEKYLQDSVRLDTLELEKLKNTIGSQLRKEVTRYSAVDMETVLYNIARESMNLMASIQLSTSEGISHASQIDQELQNLRSYNISKCLAEKKMAIKCALLLKERDALVSDVKSQLQQCEAGFNVELVMSLLGIQAKKHASVECLDKLKNMSSQMKANAENLHLHNAEELSQSKDINALLLVINGKQSKLNDYLAQNSYLLQEIGKRHLELKNFLIQAMQSVLSSIEKGTKCLSSGYHQEAKQFFHFMRCNSFQKPLVFSYSTESSSKNHELSSNLGVLPFQSKDLVLNNCVDLICDLRKKRVELECQMAVLPTAEANAPIVLSQIETKTFCVSKCAIFKKTGDEMLQLIKEGKEQPLLKDITNKIEKLIEVWWTQPAQYVPKIVMQNKSLEEWQSLLKILKKH